MYIISACWLHTIFRPLCTNRLLDAHSAGLHMRISISSKETGGKRPQQLKPGLLFGWDNSSLNFYRNLFCFICLSVPLQVSLYECPCKEKGIKNIYGSSKLMIKEQSLLARVVAA